MTNHRTQAGQKARRGVGLFGEVELFCLPSFLLIEQWQNLSQESEKKDVLVSISSPAKLGPISGNAISVSCQNSNCLRRRKRRRVIQRVKLLSSEFSAPPSTTSKAMEAARGCATKGRHHQIRRHYHYCIRFQPQSTAIFISFCFQNFSFYLGWLVKHLLPKY